MWTFCSAEGAYFGRGAAGRSTSRRRSIARATIYTTFAPCLMCTKMIINAGLHEVVYNMDYPLNEVTFKLFKDAGVVCRKLKLQ